MDSNLEARRARARAGVSNPSAFSDQNRFVQPIRALYDAAIVSRGSCNLLSHFVILQYE